MLTKLIEIRDSATFIPVMATRLDNVSTEDFYLIHKAGFGRDGVKVLLVRLDTIASTWDPYNWPSRTMHVAHKYIADNFDKLLNNQVVDVQYILGETSHPKESERYNK